MRSNFNQDFYKIGQTFNFGTLLYLTNKSFISHFTGIPYTAYLKIHLRSNPYA